MIKLKRLITFMKQIQSGIKSMSCACNVTVMRIFKSVVVATASSVSELLAFVVGVIEVESINSFLAISSIRSEVTEVLIRLNYVRISS